MGEAKRKKQQPVELPAEMVFYHFTFSSSLDAIMKEGLKPRDGVVWLTTDPRPSMQAINMEICSNMRTIAVSSLSCARTIRS